MAAIVVRSGIAATIGRSLTDTYAGIALSSVPAFTGDRLQAADVVITTGCGDACPVYPGKRYMDWDLPDPAGLEVGQIRPIRDEIRRLVAELLVGLVS